MFRSCFFALAMFSRQRRENIASVPAGLLAPWAKRTASRSAGADPPNCAPCGRGPPGVPAGFFSPCELKTHMLQVRFAHPPNCAPCGCGPPGVPAGLFSPFGLKPHDLQVRFAPPSELRPVRAWPARGSAWLIFALRAQNAHAPGSLRSPSELRPVRARPARGSGRLIGPLGQTRGLQVRFAHPPNCAPCGQSPPGGSAWLPGLHRVGAASCPARMLKTGRNVVY